MKSGDYVFYKGRKAQIITEKYGLFCIQYLDDLIKIWVNPKSLSIL